MITEDTGIYIHVPFCAKKCAYCDFYSEPYRKRTVEDYVNAVLRNIEAYSDKSCVADTIYFGGGTPSLLAPEQVGTIIQAVENNFILPENAEITLETNPNTVDLKKLSAYRKNGVNRLSVGVQSMMDTELKFLGRTHSAERAEKAVIDAYNAGFKNISCDVMIALPEQSPESLIYTLERITVLPVKHISGYILKTESGTPFDCDEIKNILPDDDTTADLYIEMVNFLKNKGFFQYEVSNFAVTGYESRHNCRYWKCLDYIGIGASAHSCHAGKRFCVDRNLKDFIENPVQKTIITDDNPCGFEEYAMLRLRLAEGLNINDFPEHKSDLLKKIPVLIKSGYINYDGNYISLTPSGFLVSNSVIEYLVF
ncbi:MAG: radical SAM family heme chaperone HemW [Muribaculaceae bacterium]|nr:radical SAM family heme chaperone HemW [Alistipes senegalensis]MCM1473348.1 radical SAM family heme chaperone HemW [Muribaculaceae bacterium]